MKNNYLILLLLLLIHINTTAQISKNNTPASFAASSSNYRISSAADIPVKDFPIMDTTTLAKKLADMNANCKSCRGNIYSYIKEVSIDVLKEATPYIINGVKIWQYSIKAKEAKGIQLYFNSFHIPKGGKLFVYNKDRSMLLGAYTEENNTDGEDYTLQPISGDEIIIEYNAPLNILNSSLGINEIGYIFKSPIERSGMYSPWGSEPCEYDVASSYGFGWEKEIRTVACVLSQKEDPVDHSISWGYEGSGALLNNSFSDAKPYFLTAKHVIDGIQPSKLIFLFNYQNTIAGFDSPLSTTNSISGCQILSQESSATSSDYALLLLNETPPAAYQVCYAGWDYADLAAQYSSQFIGIHHPQGDVKKINTAIMPLVSERADYTGAEANFWRVSWNSGITEHGSSGSPLFNNDHRIIGHLNGGYSDCSTNGPDWYGKFSVSWIDGAFSYVLKTTPIPLTSVDTYCPVYNVQCSNGVKDGTETAVDCGGTCPPCKPTCTDGIKNGNETQVDCGGSCNPCAATCFDQIRNQGETQVDCGGPCVACVAPSCTDNWKNQTETGVDCGGPCQPCANLCHDGKLNGDEIDIDCGGSCKICDGLITTDAVTNGNFESLYCPNYPSSYPYHDYATYGLHSDTKCVDGGWYSSHGTPRIENWINETPLNHSLVMAAFRPYFENDNNALASGVFYQLPVNFDPTAEYTLHFKTRYDKACPVHTLDFYVTSGLIPSPLIPYDNTPTTMAMFKEPTYTFNKFRIAQLGLSLTTPLTEAWSNTSITFTVPADYSYNQIWINAKNTRPNSESGKGSLTFLDDFVLMVSKPGNNSTDCPVDMSFTGALPFFAKAQNSITIGGAVATSINETYTVRAENFIRLAPGFIASKGSAFNADIEPCNSPIIRSNNAIPIQNTTINTYSEASPINDIGIGLRQESSLSADISVYPNPTNGTFTIKSKNGHIQEINILNIYGNFLLKSTYTESNEVQVDLPAQNAGTYIIQVFSGGNIYSKKVILVH